jgi:ribonuclease HI
MPEPPQLPAGSLTLMFDGSSVPRNPGGVALASYVILAGDQVVHSAVHEECRGGSATNNVAEWAALVAGIRTLHASSWRDKLLIRGDSQLVIRQLNLEYRCKQPHLRVYLDEAHKLLGDFVWEAEWVNRELNSLPDQMIRDHWNKLRAADLNGPLG